MKKSFFKAIIGSLAAGLTLLTVAVGTWSMPHGGGHDRDPSAMVSMLSKKLDFSQEQETAVSELLTNSYTQSKADSERLRVLHDQLHSEEGNFDAASAQAAANEIGEITARLVFLRASTFAEVSALLTEEQREEMFQMKKKRGDFHGRWRGHRQEAFE
jgi:Spy/CpxP family protein refolding chaperone